MQSSFLTFGLIAGFVVLTMADAKADEEAAQLTSACAACHRLDGRPTGIPPIVGMPPDTLVATMRAFRADEHANHIMHAVSLTLSDDEMMTIARHLAALGKEDKAP